MDLLHDPSVGEIGEFLKKLSNHKYSRALEVACGRGLLTKDLLSQKYQFVDMFDQSEEAVDEAEANNLNSRNVIFTKVYTMQEFDFTQYDQYSAIYLRWCLGYMPRPDQIKFLQRAQKALNNEETLYTRTKGPPNFIILFDNIDDCPNRKEPLVVYGQTIQSDDYHTKLFLDASLETYTWHRKSLDKDYLAIKIWTLY